MIPFRVLLVMSFGSFFVSQEVHLTKIHPINYIMRRPEWKIDLNEWENEDNNLSLDWEEGLISSVDNLRKNYNRFKMIINLVA